MGEPHDIASCARAWQTLRMAHDHVAERLRAELGRSCGLAINEFDVLLFLRLQGDDVVRLGALQEAVPLSQPALSRLVARLEERGLVARADAEDDGRVTVICLTEPGATLIDRAIEFHALAVHKALTSRLSDDEQALLLRTLSQISGQ